MIASMSSNDDLKTDTSGFGVESLDETVTVALNSSSGSEANVTFHSFPVDESLSEFQSDRKDDVKAEANVVDAEETATSAAIYGDTDEEEEKPIQTVSEMLAEDKVKFKLPGMSEFKYNVPASVSFERGRHAEPLDRPSTPPNFLPGTPPDVTLEVPMYAPIPPEEFSMHSSTALHVQGLPQVTSMPALETSPDDIQMIPRTEFQEVDRRQESLARDLMREMDVAHPPDSQTWYGTLNGQHGPRGIQVNILGDPAAAGMGAEQIMQMFTNGQAMLQPQQTEAERKVALQVQHEARIASSQAESQGRRNGGIRESLKKVREGANAAPEADKTASSAAKKGSVKPPPKPKSKGARVMALRQARSVSSKLPRPEVQSESSWRRLCCILRPRCSSYSKTLRRDVSRAIGKVCFGRKSTAGIGQSAGLLHGRRRLRYCEGQPTHENDPD